MWSLRIPLLVATIVAGAIIVFQRYAREQSRIGGPGWVDRILFQRDLASPPVMGKPYAINIAVHPDLDVDVVEFEELDPTTLTYRSVKFASPRLSQKNGATGMPAQSLQQLLDAGPTPMQYRIISPQSELVVTFAIAIPAALAAAFGVFWLARQRPCPVAPAAVATSEKNSAAMTVQLADVELAHSELRPDATEADQQSALPTAASVTSLAQSGVPEVVETNHSQDYAGEYYPVARTPRAFSMVELAVVIGVLTILVAAMLPALGVARRQAETVQCASQLHQIGAALHMYANSNGGSLPAFSGWHTWPSRLPEDSSGPAWTTELMPYLQAPDGGIYICPAMPSPFRFRSYFLAGRWSSASRKQAMKLSDVTMTGRFVLAGDKTQLALYPRPFGSSSHNSDDADPDDAGDGDPVLAWPWQRGGFYMHRRGNNVLFDDGHVATMAQFDPGSMTFNPHRMEDWPDVTPN